MESEHKDKRDWTLIVHYQMEGEEVDDWMGWYFSMPMFKGKTIQDQFDFAFEKTKPYRDGKYEPGRDLAIRLVKLAISVAFFGLHSHDLLFPDIPNKFEERFRRARAENDKSEAEKLLDKAKRLGHFGFRLGSEIDLPQPMVRYTTEDGPEQPTGRELQFAHVRSGHLRLQPKGKREDPHYELVFIKPTVIRPDLPIRDSRGFRIRRPEDRLKRRQG